jgi:hypothetical protein
MPHNHLNGRRSMSWPEFWHHFGNRWMLKLRHDWPHYARDHHSKTYQSCCFCAIDSQSRYWMFSDGGVVVTGGPLLDAPKWEGLNTRAIDVRTHVEILSS